MDFISDRKYPSIITRRDALFIYFSGTFQNHHHLHHHHLHHHHLHHHHLDPTTSILPLPPPPPRSYYLDLTTSIAMQSIEDQWTLSSSDDITSKFWDNIADAKKAIKTWILDRHESWAPA